MNLTVPERRLMMLDGETVLFRADNRAWYTLEKLTGQRLQEFLAQFQDGGMPPMQVLLDLAYSLSATDRARSGDPVSYNRDSEQYLRFAERVPAMLTADGADAFLAPIMLMVGEAFHVDVSGKPEPARGNARKRQA